MQHVVFNAAAAPGQEGASRLVQLTLFPDHRARTKREWFPTLGALADRIRVTSAPTKEALPWLKLAHFGDRRTEYGCLRHNDNVEFCTGVEADYDGEVVPFEEAVATARRAGVLCLVYTSPSHGPARPRWRVLCPAGGEIAPADRSRLLDRLDALFGGMFGRESWTLSQAYHYGSVAGRPAPMVEIVDGVSIDEIGLDPDADDEDAGLGFEDIDPDEIICGHPPEFWRRISEGIAEGARHPLMRSLAGLLIGDPMLETHLAIALIRSFAKTHCDPPFGGKELDRIIDWVARKELRG